MATEEEEKPKAFKIDDRRRFSSEGELKPEFTGPEEPARTSESPGASVLADKPREAAVGTPPAGGTSRPPQPGQHEPQAAEITFETFVVGLSTQALVHLGEIPDPQNGDSMQDLAAAQQIIDIIGLLKDKTRGNLDHNEQSLMDAILFELRMKYVERARQVAR
jgi:hypothetical protein